MTNPNPSPEFLPCPFCGTDNVALYRPALSKLWAVHCDESCDFKGPTALSKAKAVFAWNTRALSQTLPAPGEVEARKLLDDMVLGHPSFRNEHEKIDDEEYVTVDRAVEAMVAFATPTLATVAAANDEKVADDPLTRRAFAIVERMAKWDGSCAIPGDMREVQSIAAAIRLLSQGGGKA